MFLKNCFTQPCLILSGIATFGLLSTSHAAITSMPQSLGSYAIWDTFSNTGTYPTLAVTNEAPDEALATNFFATVSAAMGGSAAGSGDRLYNGTGQTSAAFNVTVNGTVTNALTSLTLAIKLTQPNGYDHENFLSLSLNGATAVATELLWITSETLGEGANARQLAVVYYTWEGLSLVADDSFSIQITSPAAGHASIDVIQLSESIPEPSALLLSGLSLCLAFVRRR